MVDGRGIIRLIFFQYFESTPLVQQQEDTVETGARLSSVDYFPEGETVRLYNVFPEIVHFASDCGPRLSLAPVKSRLVLPFWYRLTQVVLEKRPFKWLLLRS